MIIALVKITLKPVAFVALKLLDVVAPCDEVTYTPTS